MKIANTGNLDTYNIIAECMNERFLKINKMLPWIEPSINMLHLDCLRSYLFASYMSSISSILLLLEHTLRMAIFDSENAGIKRKQLNKKHYDKTLAQLLSNNYKQELKKLIPEPKNMKWWIAIKKVVRNKALHADFPSILKIAQVLKLDDKYEYSGIEDDTFTVYDPLSWGTFWHRFGEALAGDLIIESTNQILQIIDNTNWTGDVSWWASQKSEYENFFKYNWTIKNMKSSLERY